MIELDGTADKLVSAPTPSSARRCDPSAPGGIAAVYRDLIADTTRSRRVVDDLVGALARGRDCLVLTQRPARVAGLADLLRAGRSGEAGSVIRLP
jgi:hypothetical protein